MTTVFVEQPLDEQGSGKYRLFYLKWMRARGVGRVVLSLLSKSLLSYTNPLTALLLPTEGQ